MSADDLGAEQQHLGPKLRLLLWQFEGRILDDACLAEMAKTLNQELHFTSMGAPYSCRGTTRG